MPYTENGNPFATTNTSEAAAKLYGDDIKNEHIKVIYGAIEAAPLGLTCDEIELMLNLSHQTCSARLRAMVLQGRIYDTGKRRPTRSGRTARVYKITVKGSS